MADSDFFVHIEDPVEIRRILLETSKETILGLQRYQKFRLQKAKKEEKINELKKNIKEVHDVLQQLRRKLPRSKIRIKIPELKHSQKEEQAKNVPLLKKKSKKEMTALNKLELELADVERKLAKLS